MQLPLHKRMSNQEIGNVFAFIGGVLSLTETNPFRYRAYQNAAVVIEQYPKPLHEMFLTDPEFDKLPGIGQILHQKLVELFTTGGIKAFDEYTANLPGGMWSLWKVHGIGAKRAYKLAKLFQLENPDTAVADLLALAQQGHIRTIEGFGEKSEQDLITTLTHFTEPTRIPYSQAFQIASSFKSELITCDSIQQAELLGSLRRGSATVGDIDIGIATTNIGREVEFVKSMKCVKRVSVAGEQQLRAFLTTGEQVDIKSATPAEWGSFLQHFTGSKEHNIKLREFALKQHKSLSEHGIKVTNPDTDQVTLHTFTTEEEFYAFLGLHWIAPGERQGSTEILAAKM